MNSKYFIYIFLIIILYWNIIYGVDIFVNINMDYVPVESSLLIYRGKADSSNCSFLKLTNDSVFLNITGNLRTIICTTNVARFYIFIYYTNITSALINIVNKDYTIEDIFAKMQDKAIKIISITTKYISFIICQHNIINCDYMGVDQREEISGTNLNIYSACIGKADIDPCITDIEFSIETFNISNIIGNIINIVYSNMKPTYRKILNCHNGGTLVLDNKTNKSSCKCQELDSFLEAGPRCESLQQYINRRQYLYILPNTNNLIIEFSLSSPAHAKATEIFKIKDENRAMIMQYTILEHKHIFNISGSSRIIDYPLDMFYTWLDISLNLFGNKIIIKINEKEDIVFINIVWPLQLDTLPLILHDEPKSNIRQICLRNLKINFRIVDLYTPNYSDCVQGRCNKCNPDEKCVYVPFKSEANVECICKIGIKKSNICTNSNSAGGQIPNNVITQPLNIPSTIGFANFMFRTLSDKGTLVTLSLSNPKYYYMTIEILDKLLLWNFGNKYKSLSSGLYYHEVSDGEWHTINLKMTNYMIEITLDDRIPYNSNSTWFPKDFFTNVFDYPVLEGISFGPLVNSYLNSSNLSTCFHTFTIINITIKGNEISNIIFPPNIFHEGCEDGADCETVKCADNQECEAKWQNNKCVCIKDFVDLNETCIYYKCVENPCKNNGECVYHESSKDYKCLCINQYQGTHCEWKARNFPWWIILLVLLILLIMILLGIILYKCCKTREKFRDIDKIHENIVCYNDQAGETDYCGPPINFDLIRKPFNEPLNEKQTIDLLKRKQTIDADNGDLILDQTLEYGFEGLNSDLVSVSSLGSGSTDEELNIQPIQNSNKNFMYLKNFYK